MYKLKSSLNNEKTLWLRVKTVYDEDEYKTVPVVNETGNSRGGTRIRDVVQHRNTLEEAVMSYACWAVEHLCDTEGNVQSFDRYELIQYAIKVIVQDCSKAEVYQVVSENMDFFIKEGTNYFTGAYRDLDAKTAYVYTRFEQLIEKLLWKVVDRLGDQICDYEDESYPSHQLFPM